MAKIRPDEPCPCGSGKTYSECHGLRRADDHAGATLIIPLQGTSEPDPGTRAVFEGIGDTTILFRGTENTVAYACHSCGATLLLGVDIDTVSNIVLRCANCKSFNESQPATAPPS